MAVWQDLPDGNDFTPSTQNFGEAETRIPLGDRERSGEAESAWITPVEIDHRALSRRPRHPKSRVCGGPRQKPEQAPENRAKAIDGLPINHGFSTGQFLDRIDAERTWVCRLQRVRPGPWPIAEHAQRLDNGCGL